MKKVCVARLSLCVGASVCSLHALPLKGPRLQSVDRSTHCPTAFLIVAAYMDIARSHDSYAADRWDPTEASFTLLDAGVRVLHVVIVGDCSIILHGYREIRRSYPSANEEKISVQNEQSFFCFEEFPTSVIFKVRGSSAYFLQSSSNCFRNSALTWFANTDRNGTQVIGGISFRISADNKHKPIYNVYLQ